MEYRAVITDFDRTLLHTDKTISAYTFKVLQSLQKSGIRLFAATARPERAITEYCEIIRFDAVTTLNGARTITKANVIENPISPSISEMTMMMLNRSGAAVVEWR